jgi:hypothetical protein
MAEADDSEVAKLWSDRAAEERSTQLMLIGYALSGLAPAGFVDPEDPLLRATPLPRPLTTEAQTRSLDWLRQAALGLLPRPVSSGSPYNLAADQTPQEYILVRPLGDNPSEFDIPPTANRLLGNIASFSSARSAVTLLSESLRDADEVVRTVAAAVLHSLGRTEEEAVQVILQTARRSSDATASAIGSVILGTSTGSDETADDLNEERDDVADDDNESPASGADNDSGSCSVMLHGTFARLTSQQRRWYAPSSPLSNHVRSHASRDLYAGQDYPRWAAGFSDAARAQGTADLLKWCARHGLSALDTVYAHSHGGNVVLDAIEQGLRVKLLVLLHVPVIERSTRTWSTIEQNVGRVLDLRTGRDLVVAADRLHRKANRLPLSENRLPQLPWVHQPQRSVLHLFDTSHRRFIQLKTWRRNAIANDVRSAWLLA